MVSARCKMLVKAELEKLGLKFCMVDLGEVELKETPSPEQLTNLNQALLQSGLELMEDKRAVLIQKIKTVIIEMVHYADELPRIKNSDYISQQLNYDYTYLAGLFSATTGITIEQFIIAHKIERVKELLIYDELNLTEISYRLNYSSVAHLSSQFKKITGLTPTYFKKLKHQRRTPLESL
ncbi:MAG: helix-turn-helix transcriptional regulator [Dinghuibacter sp.]|nr:helix-turn-helix transcriptional regulator [Dinghuibacter sp.]